MNPPLSAPLADLLRSELAGYGGLLAYFERQQAALLRRDAQSVAELSLAIERLATEAALCRKAREAHVASLALAAARPAETSLRRLLDLFPSDQQPLLAALIEEINRLLHVVRRRSRQNHAILTRAVELHREMLATLRPDAFPRTYAPGGRLGSSPALRSTLQATG